MNKIIIKGEAETLYPYLKELNGINCQDSFVEYFDDYQNHYEAIMKKGLEGGHMSFKFEDNKLWTVTEYFSNEPLTEEELESLKDYTTGQWSDGIGEGFEQEPCFHGELHKNEDGELTTEVFISPWSSEADVTIEQHEG